MAEAIWQSDLARPRSPEPGLHRPPGAPNGKIHPPRAGLAESSGVRSYTVAACAYIVHQQCANGQPVSSSQCRILDAAAQR